MRLLEKTAHQAVKEGRLNDVVILHINHCMDNTFSFNDVLRKLFENVILVTPPYGNQDIPEQYEGSCYHGMKHDGAYRLMKNRTELERGIYSGIEGGHERELDCEIERRHERELECESDCGHTDFMEATLTLLEEAFRRELIPLLRSGKKLLIIEDGGYHFEVLPRVKRIFPDIEDKIIGVVEQTTSGTRRSMDSQGYRYAYPCISVARSDIKMNVESIFIGQRIVEELAQMLYEADTFFPFHTVLILGYGIIGRSCRMALEGKFCKLKAYDINPDMLQVAKKEGVQVYTEASAQMFEEDTIVIGCVGSPSFTEEMFRAYLDGQATNLYLASGSSKDVEFAKLLDYLRKHEEELPRLQLMGRDEAKWHSCYHFLYDGCEKNVYIMAEGKPVNFYREGVISLTHRMIDLVFTEMLEMALYLCDHRELAPQLYILGEDNPITRAGSEKKLLDSWFCENNFFYEANLEEFLRPHPNAATLRHII